MINFATILEGKKTFIIALAMLAYATLGLLLGKIPEEQVIQLILEALGLAALRNAIK